MMDLTVPAGEHRDLVLEISDQALPERPPDADRAWAATENGWADAVPDLGNCHTPQDAQRSCAVLRGLTSRSGGMVAAATTSLPERAETGRNYDYRYVWIRDQCYAGQAVAAAGDHPLLQDAVGFVTDRLLADGDRMTPAYTCDARPVPDQVELDLPGYLGRTQPHRQLGQPAVPARRTEPDAGIWEIDNRRWTHSRLICAAGLRALAAHLPAGGAAAGWLTLADAITAETSADSLHPTGRWQRSPDDPGWTPHCWLPALRGAMPADDPRTLATLAAYQRELTVNGYAYRFRHDRRPLADSEGASARLVGASPDSADGGNGRRRQVPDRGGVRRPLVVGGRQRRGAGSVTATEWSVPAVRRKKRGFRAAPDGYLGESTGGSGMSDGTGAEGQGCTGLDGATVVQRDGTVTLHDLTLLARPGELLAVLGPSGSGKSTLLRAIAGLAKLQSGRVLVAGRPTSSDPAHRDLAMVFERTQLMPLLDVARNMGFGLSTRKVPAPEVERRVDQQSRRLRVGKLLRRMPNQLSSGEQGQVGIGRALVRTPKAFLLDEPLAHVDAHERARMRRVIAETVRATKVEHPVRHPRPVRRAGHR